MLKFNKTLLTALIVFAVSTVSLVYGQNQQDANLVFVTEKNHQVIDNDNTWDLSKEIFYSGYKWREIAEMNPFLEDGRLREKWYDDSVGMWFCELFPGETIHLGYEKVEPIIAQDIPGAIAPTVPTEQEDERSFAWLWWLLLIPLLIFFLRFLRKQRESDPIGSGAPQVDGGVNNDGAIRRAQNIASTINGINPRLLNVTNIERGRFYGRGRAFYADKPNGLTKRFNGEDGFRARVRREDGTEEVVYFLQACGNDVRVGNFLQGINFVPDEDQPKTLVQHNDTVVTKEEEENASEEPSASSFDSDEKIIGILTKLSSDTKKVFFEAKTPSGATYKFDTLNIKSK